MVVEAELRKLKAEMRAGFDEIRKLIVGKNLVGNWVMQPMACAMLNVGVRQLQKIRKHTNKEGQPAGTIRWRKGKGRTVQYYKPDLENYLNLITIS